ncbi:Hypothetical_protein [Hexamita inflata]|uniref:Hypothetical_protein n=1 Tax=Hexamita inflata TaxID=28002 RepID=A0AA86Q1H4_9EUKA|nr:Hypothetical protein HINF_LOCUS37731 [Hexamita inflata]
MLEPTVDGKLMFGKTEMFYGSQLDQLESDQVDCSYWFDLFDEDFIDIIFCWLLAYKQFSLELFSWIEDQAISCTFLVNPLDKLEGSCYSAKLVINSLLECQLDLLEREQVECNAQLDNTLFSEHLIIFDFGLSSWIGDLLGTKIFDQLFGFQRDDLLTEDKTDQQFQLFEPEKEESNGLTFCFTLVESSYQFIDSFNYVQTEDLIDQLSSLLFTSQSISYITGLSSCLLVKIAFNFITNSFSNQCVQEQYI